VPLVARRQSGSATPFTLTASLVPERPGSAAQPALVDDDVDHTFRWYFKPLGGVSGERLVRVQDVAAGAMPVDTLAIAPRALPGQPVFVDGAQAGLYRVVIDRAGGSSRLGGSTFASDAARLRIDAQCARCERRFELGAGVPRQFGECEWRAKPIDESLLAYRSGAEFRSFVQAFGSPAGGGAGSGYVSRARAPPPRTHC